jgi:hypothetical protein
MLMILRERDDRTVSRIGEVIRFRPKTVALSNSDFGSLKIERLSPLSDQLDIPGLSKSFPEIFFMISADKCESDLISP